MQKEIQENPLPEKKKCFLPCCSCSGWKVIACVIVGLLILSGAVYAGYQLGRKSVPPAQILIDNGPVEIEVSPTPEPTTNWKTYTNTKVGGENPGISLFPAENHSISVQVWRVTGFGYCFNYGEKKETVVGNKKAETADGIGGAEACDQPEKYVNKGNTFVLIPLDESATGIPPNQIHISYDYPLSEKDKAKSNLDQILFTFKFAQ